MVNPVVVVAHRRRRANDAAGKSKRIARFRNNKVAMDLRAASECGADGSTSPEQPDLLSGTRPVKPEVLPKLADVRGEGDEDQREQLVSSSRPDGSDEGDGINGIGRTGNH